MAARKLDGGLGTGIFILPQIFGWYVLRPGYGTFTRIAVFAYMILSTVPLYFLIATLWTSGGDIIGMSRDFGRNRAVAERGVGEAHRYMDEYEKGDLKTQDAEYTSNGSQDGRAASTSALRLAQEAERGPAAISALQGRSIEVTGNASAASTGETIYLDGTETYPAVTLHMAGPSRAIAKGDEVHLTCDGLTVGPAGPELRNCQ